MPVSYYHTHISNVWGFGVFPINVSLNCPTVWYFHVHVHLKEQSHFRIPQGFNDAAHYIVILNSDQQKKSNFA